jgi:hypothetical protein
MEKLGIGEEGSKARFSAYLAEHPRVAVRRTELLSKEKRLVAVLDQLSAFEAHH